MELSKFNVLFFQTKRNEPKNAAGKMRPHLASDTIALCKAPIAVLPIEDAQQYVMCCMRRDFFRSRLHAMRTCMRVYTLRYLLAHLVFVLCDIIMHADRDQSSFRVQVR